LEAALGVECSLAFKVSGIAARFHENHGRALPPDGFQEPLDHALPKASASLGRIADDDPSDVPLQAHARGLSRRDRNAGTTEMN